MTFIVPGRPVPKPRMTRRDKWATRPIVMRYRAYATKIQKEYRKEAGTIWSPDKPTFTKVRPVEMGFDFYICGGSMDIKNLIAGVEDALVGIAISDDCIAVVRAYSRAEAFLLDCSACPEGPKPCKGRMDACPQQRTVIRLEPYYLEGLEDKL